MTEVDVEDGDARTGTQRLYEATLDSLPLNVAILDADGTIVESNAAWQRFGRDNDIDGSPDTVGVNYLDICDPIENVYADRAAEGIRSVLDGEQDLFTMEYPCHSPTEKRWFLLRVSPVSGEGTQHVVVAHVDITERKLAELEVEAKADELEEKRQNLTMLNQVVRHDIRNEMSVVLTWARMLTDYVEAGHRDELGYILDAGEQVVELTKTVGNLTELLVSEDDIPLHPVSLEPVVRSAAENLRAKNAARDSDVTVSGLDDVPQVEVLADDVLSSVFVNLLNNAVLHNDSDHPHVDVSTTVRDETVEVRLADDGPGIPDERKSEVFGRGEKGFESDGTGLGLYLVDRTVERYGGRVRVEDNDPTGAVFRVELPLA